MEVREKESEIACRRIGRIADHVAGSWHDASRPNHQLFPVNCSSALNSTTPRRDNRMLFARQGSASQARFMRQISVSQLARADACPLQNPPTTGAATFARPTQTPQNPTPQVNLESSCEPPNFARPLREMKNNHLPKTAVEISSPSGARMDVAETASFHVLTLEIPGANIVDIKVEVDDKNLTVTGKRSSPRWSGASGENDVVTYHKRQIAQGPYVVVWPLPNDVDRDAISAELLNGFLRITLPKIVPKRIHSPK